MSMTLEKFKAAGELAALQELEALVRINLAYPDSVAESRSKRKIKELLVALDEFREVPFDAEAACQKFLLSEMDEVLYQLREVVRAEEHISQGPLTPDSAF